jgi:ParB-like chromosome segregation protein Spo0J
MARKSHANGTALTVPTLSQTEVRFYPLSMFTFDPAYNLRRFDPSVSEADKSFLQTVITPGKVQTPVTATVGEDGKLIVQAGHRRVAAARLAESSGAVKPFPSIPVLAVDPAQTPVQRTYDLFVSNNGKALTPIEQAAGVKRLLDAGEKHAAIGKHIGATTQWVRMLASMAELPETLASAVYAGNIGSTLAAELQVSAAREDGGFDLLDVWAKAATIARLDGKWDGARYAWKVTQKHIDTVLKDTGIVTAKTRNVEGKPGKKSDAPVTPAATPAATPGAPVTPAATPAPVTPAATPAGAPVTVNPRVVDPNERPAYRLNGATILDVNGKPLAVCDSETVATRIMRVLATSGERIACAPVVVARPVVDGKANAILNVALADVAAARRKLAEAKTRLDGAKKASERKLFTLDVAQCQAVFNTAEAKAKAIETAEAEAKAARIGKGLEPATPAAPVAPVTPAVTPAAKPGKRKPGKVQRQAA